MSASLNRTLSGARSSNLAPQAECLSFLCRWRFQTFSILLTGLNPQLSLHFLLNRRHREVIRWNFLQLPACLVPTLSLSFLFWWKRCPRLLRLKLCRRPAPSGLLRDYTLVSILSAGFFPLVFTYTLISPILKKQNNNNKQLCISNTILQQLPSLSPPVHAFTSSALSSPV